MLRDIVTAEREKGVVICSSSAGYYLSANRDEIREFCNFMEKRGKHTMKGGYGKVDRNIIEWKNAEDIHRAVMLE